MKKIFYYIGIILGCIFILILFLYAKEGRLSIDILKTDFIDAVNDSKEKRDEKLNYNSITYETFVAKLKSKGLVVGDVEIIPANSLGASVAVKFNVDGKYIHFYNIDWSDTKNKDIIKTKEYLDKEGKVFVEGKMYEALVNDTAVITKYETNKSKAIIKEEFEKIIPLSYDKMIEMRDKAANDNNVIDNIIDNINQTTNVN